MRGLPLPELIAELRDYLLDVVDPFTDDLPTGEGSANDLVVDAYPGVIIVQVVGDRTWVGRVLGTSGETAEVLKHLIRRATGARTVEIVALSEES